MTLGPAVGRADDFYALGFCPELDEHERRADPSHTSFTFIVRYDRLKKTIVDRVRARLDGLWQPPQPPLLAVGEPSGIIEIDATGAREVALSPPPLGEFNAVWGASDAHVFACGGQYQPFVFYRRGGKWLHLPAPVGAAPPNDVRGFHENEVYFVAEKGQIWLWDGQSLTQRAVPTTRHLTGIAQLNDKLMCISGYQGTLLVGSKVGWRIVPTGTEEPLLSIASLHGAAYYGADGALFSFDGVSPPSRVIDVPARWVSSLDDALVLVDGEDAGLFRQGVMTSIDTTV
jgi:hypothetical protein